MVEDDAEWLCACRGLFGLARGSSYVSRFINTLPLLINLFLYADSQPNVDQSKHSLFASSFEVLLQLKLITIDPESLQSTVGPWAVRIRR